MNRQPIAVFDSGLGGLSVVRHLRRLLPHEDIVYFGDTARVPYGIKSQPTVVHFALENARFLQQFDPKLIAVACNTVSALALAEVAEAVSVPVVGVLEPGARAAAALAARGGAITLLGTEATVSSGAYEAALARLAPGVRVIGVPCPLFVPLVEEGRVASDPIVAAVAREYLAPLRGHDVRVAILGCTHYPLLRDAISAALGPGVEIVDSGRETSHAIHDALAQADALSDPKRAGSIRCFVSDNPARFGRIGSRFLEETIDAVELVPPEAYVAATLDATRHELRL